VAAELDNIELANRNHETLMFLVKEIGSHSEWVATIAFYKAVQVIEAVFDAHLKIHSHGHDSRIETLKSPIFRRLFTPFRPLFAASLVARYLQDNSSKKIDEKPNSPVRYRSFSDFLSPADVVNRLLKKRLHVLEQESLQFLSEAGRKLLKKIEPARL